ncbi:MAG: hypothetical protein CMO34_05490 [Verrucomicrobia bacterium]|nr:hypothetical protein [Verrucomicrobiota bacterium]|tara:strand:+ start:116 stop:682 length:567 start_codon:yes stop_codon:yes gene_type:complete
MNDLFNKLSFKFASMMKRFAFLLLLLPFVLNSQPIVRDGLPLDLNQEKIILLKHEKIEVKADKKAGKQQKYLYLRQSNHNSVIEESNEKLILAAMDYPFEYAISTLSKYKSILKAGYKYVLISNVYKNEHLYSQPNEGELIVFEYFILDVNENVAFKVFELDEMKVYDSKMLIRRLNKALKKQYPESY